MKKIIIPFDGSHFSKGAFSSLQMLNNFDTVLLIAVFLPSVDYARFFFLPAAFAPPAYVPLLENFEEDDVAANIEHLEELCLKNGIEYRIHKDLYDSAIPQLSKETRFADLMIVGSEVFYKGEATYGTMEYLKDTLHRTECPVLIVPENFTTPSHTTLAYDGTSSSVFAIKQFAYLFPELCDNETVLLYAGKEKDQMPDQDLIGELAARHYKDLTITSVTSGSKNDTRKLFEDHPDSMVVTGSFGRSGISELFTRSFIMDLIKEYKNPVFIAHR